MGDLQKSVAKYSELVEGKMKQVRVGKTFVLLTKLDGQVHAVGAKCPHYGALLGRGVQCGHRVVCPWHSAVFDARNGDLIDPPALDGLPQYKVRVEGDEVFVDVPEVGPDRRTPPMDDFHPERDPRTFAILGAGAAGAAAAESLRQEGYQGRILLISREDRLPYDRPPLSKDFLAGRMAPESLPLRPETFYQEHHIERVLDTITSFDIGSRTVTLRNHPPIKADAVLIATGAAARCLNVPGADLHNIHTLRSWEDGEAIKGAIQPDRKVVIIGAGFIGLEAASMLVKMKLAVTVVAPGTEPLERVFGREVGAWVRELHEKNGVLFRMGRSLKQFTGTDGAVSAVELDNGETLPADVVLAGVGARPATDFIEGVSLNKDGGINVDEHLCVAEGVYAAGDVACYPDPYTSERHRIEHWKVAMQQGRTAARNLLDRNEPFTSVPFFWTDQYGMTLGYAGHASSWDEILMQKDAKGQFMAYYVRGNRLLAAAGTKGEQLGAFMELMRMGRLPSVETVRENAGLDLVGLL